MTIDRRKADKGLPQSSSVYIVGGLSTEFNYNQFLEHRGMLDEHVRVNGSDIYSFFPDDYFKFSHASLIRIEYPVASGIDIELEGVYKITFTGNLFRDNKNYQNIAFAGIPYYGSLVHFDSHISLT